MLDYMRALRKWFAEEPNCREIETEIEKLHRSLLRLIDLEMKLQDEIVVVNFLSGFKLAWGIAKELGATYSFAADEEERACELAEKEVMGRG